LIPSSRTPEISRNPSIRCKLVYALSYAGVLNVDLKLQTKRLPVTQQNAGPLGIGMDRTNVTAVNMQAVLIPVEFVCFNHPSQIR
jgi:hypothetical protein